MTVRRLLTTSGLITLSLFLMAFQEPETPATPDGIPWLIWLLLALVAVGLLLLAFGRREVDAFAVPHHDDHGHGSHGHDDHGHDEHGHGAHGHDDHGHDDHEHAHHEDAVHDDNALLGVDGTHNVNTALTPEPEPEEVETTIAVIPPVIPMATGEPAMPIVIEVPDESVSVADADTMTEAPDDSVSMAPVETVASVPDTATPVADVAVADVDAPSPTLPATETPETATPILPMSVSVSQGNVPIPAVAPDTSPTAEDEPLPALPADEEPTEPVPSNPSSSIGQRERPRNFPKVDIPDTSPAAKGAVRDTMEFRYGEDNPGEIVQRPATGDRPDPTPMSMGSGGRDTMEFRYGEDNPGEVVQRPTTEDRPEPTPMSMGMGGGGLATNEVDVPELDVPDLGMPALDAASHEEGIVVSDDATQPIASDLLESKLYEGESGGSQTPTVSGNPSWFVGGVDTPAPRPVAAPAAEWENSTLEPPNEAEGAASLPTITLPAYDTDKIGAPKWLVTGDNDDGNDDLQIIEGIGPKIASILNSSGIRSFRRLASTSADNLREILDKSGISHIADPSSWAEQAQHAAEGAMDKLQELQARLKGGRKDED